MYFKTKFLAMGLCCIATAAIAQQERTSLIPALAQNTWVVGLQGNYTIERQILSPSNTPPTSYGYTDTLDNVANLGASLNVGRMLANNFYMGIDVHQMWHLRPPMQNRGDSTRATQFLMGVQMRYYIPITAKLTTYIEGELGYISNNQDSKRYYFYQNGTGLEPILRYSSKISAAGIGGYAGCGLMYMVGDKISIDAGLRYQGSSAKGSRSDSFPSTPISNDVRTYDYLYETQGFGARLGVQFFLK